MRTMKGVQFLPVTDGKIRSQITHTLDPSTSPTAPVGMTVGLVRFASAVGGTATSRTSSIRRGSGVRAELVWEMAMKMRDPSAVCERSYSG